MNDDLCLSVVLDLLDDIVSQDCKKTTLKPGVWMEDTTLGPGWKTCLLNPLIPLGGHDKRMFSSPCGQLLYSREQAENFVRGRTDSNMAHQFEAPRVEKKIVSAKRSPIKPVEVCLVKLDKMNSNYKLDLEEISLSDEDFEEEPDDFVWYNNKAIIGEIRLAKID